MSIPGRGLSKAYARGRARIRELNAADDAASVASNPQLAIPCSSAFSASVSSRSVRSSPSPSSARAGAKPCPCGCGMTLPKGRLVCRDLWSDLDAYWRRALTSGTRVERLVATRHILAVAAELRRVRGATAAPLPKPTEAA